MKILTFDTCFNKTYIVYGENKEIIEEKIIESSETNYHSAYLISGIRDILKSRNIQIKDIDVIGVNTGPGSFTGIRAGITVARIFAQQTNIKTVGINSLKILSKLNITEKPVIVMTDARKNKVYYAKFNKSETIFSPCLKEKDKIEDLVSSDVFVITDESICKYLREKNIFTLDFNSVDNNLGRYLYELVSENITADKENFHWAKLKPLYIQPPSISKPKTV